MCLVANILCQAVIIHVAYSGVSDLQVKKIASLISEERLTQYSVLGIKIAYSAPDYSSKSDIR